MLHHCVKTEVVWYVASEVIKVTVVGSQTASSPSLAEAGDAYCYFDAAQLTLTVGWESQTKVQTSHVAVVVVMCSLV